MGGFSSKNEKNKYIFGKKKKSLFYKSALTFYLGGLKKELWALSHLFDGTPWGHYRAAKIDFWTKKIWNSYFSYPKATKKHRIQIHTGHFCLMPSVQSLCIFVHFFSLRGQKMPFFDQNAQKSEFFSPLTQIRINIFLTFSKRP